MAIAWHIHWRRLLNGALLAGLAASYTPAAFAQANPRGVGLLDRVRDAMGGEASSAQARDEDLRPLAGPRRALIQAKPAQPQVVHPRKPPVKKPSAVPQTVAKPQAEGAAQPLAPLTPTVFDNGTHLQLQSSRPAMIFAPGDKFELTVIPSEVEVYPERPIHCRLQIFPTGSNQIIWTDEKTTQATKDGVITEVGPFKVTVPNVDGSYDLAVLFNRQETGKAGTVAWSYVRRIQFAVVGTKPLAVNRELDDTTWKMSQEIDLRGIAPPSGDESLLNLIPGLGPQKKAPTAHSGPGKLSERKFLNGTVVEIPARGWRAVPLTVRKLDRPHLVEIEYPDDQPQSAAIAVLEPNQTSGAGLALDHGWESAASSGSGKLQKHRFAFWPSSGAAVLMIANRDSNRPLAIHSIRVLAGGDELPPSGPAPNREERLVAASFGASSLLDAFSARIALDQDNAPIADWKTWCDAGTRLTQYLRHAGFNGASVPIVNEGGALYPSKHFPPYVDPQRGIAAYGPKDLQEKDVVELLLQMFDREGLRLVTTVHFTSPLPELEELVQAGEPGILLDAPPGADAGDLAPPRYNPLHPQVQDAIAKVVAEIVSRYGRHPSFGGVAIAWTNDSYVRLPGPTWGADELTLSQFFNDEQLQPPELTENDNPLAILDHDEPLKQRWLKWRAAQMTGLYLRCGEEVAKADGPARLYLLGGQLLDTPAARAAVDLTHAPAVGWRADEILLEQGIDAELCRSQERLTIVRPQSAADYPRTKPSLDELRPGETDLAVASAAADGFAAALIEHPTRTFELQTKALDKTGLKTEQLTLVGQAAPSGAAYRRAWLDRFAANELQAIFVGGSAPPFGREEAVRDLITILRKLPAMPFETITEGTEPIVARVARVEDKLYLTLTNNSPWAATIQIAFEGEVQSIENVEDGQKLGKTTDQGKPIFRRILQPFSCVAVAITGKDAQIGSCRTAIDSRFTENLRREAVSLQSVVGGGKTLNVPVNPGFEAAGDGRTVPGWQLRASQGLTSEVGDGAHGGSRALHIVGAQEDSIFGTAATGAAFAKPGGKRFALRFFARTDSFERDHMLRVLVEAGATGGMVLQSRDFGPEGQSRRISPLSADWTECEIPLDGIPEEVRQLRIRFVFRGTGSVWIDDLQLADEGLSQAEREELTQVWTAFDEHLAAGRVASADRVLRSAWPQYARRLQGDASPAVKRVEPATPPPSAAPQPIVKAPPQPTPKVAAPVKSPLPPIAAKSAIAPAMKNEEIPPLVDESPAEPLISEPAPPAPSYPAVARVAPPQQPTVPSLPPKPTSVTQLLRLPEVAGKMSLEQDELDIPTADLPPIRTTYEAPPRPSQRKPEAPPVKVTKKSKTPKTEPAKTALPSISSLWNGGWLPTRKSYSSNSSEAETIENR